MKKMTRMFLILPIFFACALTENNALRKPPDRWIELFGAAVKSIDEYYYRPVSYQSLLIGAIQGLENDLGPTGWLCNKNGNLRVVSPRTHRTYSIAGGSASDVSYMLDAISDIVDYTVEKFPTNSRKDTVIMLMNGMISSLDEYCTLWTPDDLELFHERQMHPGLMVSIIEEYPVVVATSCESPAQHAGVRAGDSISAIDGVPTKGRKLSSIKNQFWGREGTVLELEINRSHSLEREKIQLSRVNESKQTVYTDTTPDGYARLWIARFTETTVDGFSDALKRLENDRPVKGLIIDLRHNAGGVLIQAIDFVDLFMDDGVIMTAKGRKSRVRVFKATPNAIWKGLKLIVLVNGQTYGTAAIIAAAFQDHQLALVAGTPTASFKSIQGIETLPMGYFLKFSISQYFRPRSDQIESTRIHPDLLIDISSPGYMGNLCQMETDALAQMAFDILRKSASSNYEDMLKAASIIQ